MVGEINLNITQNDTIKKIYEGEINTDKLRANPILRPVLEVNSSYYNSELIIFKALSEYTQILEEIKKMPEQNPIYQETILFSKMSSILNSASQIIHAYDMQKNDMKNTINKMIEICNREYAPLTEDYINMLKNQESVTMNKQETLIEETIKNSGDSKYSSEIV